MEGAAADAEQEHGLKKKSQIQIEFLERLYSGLLFCHRELQALNPLLCFSIYRAVNPGHSSSFSG